MGNAKRREGFEILTIGHSTRPIAEFVGLLVENGVEILVDIRTIPKSAHNPQFGGAVLKKTLRKHGIEYRYLKDLGGLRKPRKDSIHTGWRNRSFQGYADYMESAEFKAALAELLAISKTALPAIMCAEAVPWRCHRNLVADELVFEGHGVGHILGPGKVSPHRITAWARVRGGRLVYPPERPSA